MTDTRGGLPKAVLEHTGAGAIAAVLESLLTRQRRFPAANAEQLPVRVTQADGAARIVEIPHLVTTRMSLDEPGWVPCYDILPWENHRSETDIEQASYLGAQLMYKTAADATSPDLTPEQLLHRRRMGILFAVNGRTWRPELATERCAILDQAGLPEAGQGSPLAGSLIPECRHWLASALSHLRRPLRSLSMPAELMPDRFTIPQFQAAAEGLLGQALDKQVFRRNAINSGFLEDTGGHSDEVAGRPAKLFRFRIDFTVARSMQTMPLALPLADGLARYETIDLLLKPLGDGPHSDREKTTRNSPPDPGTETDP
ncbi:NrtR DNA-binding winged helix domain-containing protein [Acetobacter oeni]|nr:hypothetical protein [Acetobacter oeni]MBB3881614.1 hypothetical protein [Acetobacter oeni]